MGFHYARDHDLAGFGGRSANSRIEFTERRFLPPNSIADLQENSQH